jgi:outer membrane protein assembly factor BamB
MADRPTAKVRITKLPYRVEKAVVKGRIIVTLADIPLGEGRARNIFGVTRDGTFKWRVAEVTDAEGRATPFADVFMDKAGKVWARTVNGVLYRINEDTGKLSDQ